MPPKSAVSQFPIQPVMPATPQDYMAVQQKKVLARIRQVDTGKLQASRHYLTGVISTRVPKFS